MSHIEKILSLLSGVKPATKGNYNADCPCAYHKKKNNKKLYLKEVPNDSGSMVLLDCKSGCTAEEIMGAIGLELKDIYSPISEVDKSRYRRIQAEKRQIKEKDDVATRLYVAVTIIQQCIDARRTSGDKHPEGKFDAWDREKQALRVLPNLLKEYYRD